MSPFPFLLLFLSVHQVISEFRFCYKGPHRFTEKTCPGGFIANEKLSVSCAYFARTPHVPTARVSVLADVCDASTPYEIDVFSKNEDDFASFGREIQQLRFEFDDQPMPEEDEGGKIQNDTCFNTCLEEWVDLSLIEDEPFIDDGTGGSNETAEDTARKINQDLFSFLLDADEEDDESPMVQSMNPYDDPFTSSIDASWGEGPRILKLLGLSMRIVLKECAPFTQEEFLRQVHRAMSWFTRKNQTIITDVTSLEYNYYVGVLHRCYQRRNLDFLLNGTKADECGPVGTPKVSGIYYIQKDIYWKYRQTGKSFRWKKHTPYVEAAWNVVEFIHGYCFESFLWDLMDLHSFTTAMEGLFTSLVMRQWLSWTSLKNEVFWNSVFRVDDIKITMRNLDACVIGGNSMAPWTKRLERPYVSEAASSLTEPDPRFPVQPLETGWKRSPAEYWQWYEKQGGFKEISKTFGVCVDEVDSISNVDVLGEASLNVRKKQCAVPAPDTPQAH